MSTPLEPLVLIWIAILSLLGVIISAIIAGYFSLKGIKSRSGSENFHDDMLARKYAQELVAGYEKQQVESQREIKELREKVEHLTSLLEGTQIRHTSVIGLGDIPRVISTEVELLVVRK